MTTQHSDHEALRLASVSKQYGSGPNAVAALRDVTLSLPQASFTAVMGPSGSGKSTLLHCASGLDQPSAGEVFIGGSQMRFGDETELTEFRRSRIGFVFQQLNLLPTLTALQNVTLPLLLAGKKPDRKYCQDVLERVGLGDRLHVRPAQLSGGQQQRVAIARALVSNPSVLFADEPTGALDTNSARDVLELIQGAVRDFGQTVVMVTHDPVAASYAHTVLFLTDGRIVGRLVEPTAASVAEQMTNLGSGSAHTVVTK